MEWINVNEKLPEDFEELLIKPTDELSPLKTKRILAMTDTGSITDNRRLKMQVGDEEWVWAMGYDGEEVVKWTVFEEPIQSKSNRDMSYKHLKTLTVVLDEHEATICIHGTEEDVLDSSFVSPEDVKMYAQLFSKAPEMLEAMQDFVREFEGDYTIDGDIVDSPNLLLVTNYKKFKNLIKEAIEV